MKHLNAPQEGYVFIVTYGRSGSTLLQALLNRIEGYCIRGENNATLTHLARAWDAVEDAEPMRGSRRLGAPTEPDQPWYGAELVDPDRYGRVLADAFVRGALRPPPGTRVAGFKEIRHTSDAHLRFFDRQMTFMRRFFPRARFIFNTRDHAAVARSGWWARMEPETVAARLRRSEALFEAHVAKHPRSSLLLRYEDYNANPEGLRPLFEFLNEPFEAEMTAQVLARRLDHLQPAREG